MLTPFFFFAGKFLVEMRNFVAFYFFSMFFTDLFLAKDEEKGKIRDSLKKWMFLNILRNQNFLSLIHLISAIIHMCLKQGSFYFLVASVNMEQLTQYTV